MVVEVIADQQWTAGGSDSKAPKPALGAVKLFLQERWSKKPRPLKFLSVASNRRGDVASLWV